MARFYVSHPHVEKGILRVEGTEVRHIGRFFASRPETR